MTDIENVIFEAMLKEAVTVNFRTKMKAMPSEEELLREYPPSVEHNRKMKALFAWERRRTVLKRTLSFAKAAVIALCVAATLFFATLLFSSEVRAAVREAIVQFFEGFTRIEFVEPDEPVREARDFTLGYIPEGYVQESTEEYGNNCLTLYTDTDGNILMFDIGPLDVHAVDIDNRAYYSEEHDGVTYYVFMADNDGHFSGVVWEREGFSFCLDGIISKEELLKMARSLD